MNSRPYPITAPTVPQVNPTADTQAEMQQVFATLNQLIKEFNSLMAFGGNLKAKIDGLVQQIAGLPTTWQYVSGSSGPIYYDAPVLVNRTTDDGSGAVLQVDGVECFTADIALRSVTPASANIGNGNTVTTTSFCIGNGNSISAGSYCVGNSNTATYFSSVIGFNNNVTATGVAIGNWINASGPQSVAIGCGDASYGLTTTYNFSVVIGYGAYDWADANGFGGIFLGCVNSMTYVNEVWFSILADLSGPAGQGGLCNLFGRLIVDAAAQPPGGYADNGYDNVQVNGSVWATGYTTNDGTMRVVGGSLGTSGGDAYFVNGIYVSGGFSDFIKTNTAASLTSLSCATHYITALAPITDGTDAIRFVKAASPYPIILSMDSTNQRVGIHMDTPAHTLDVTGDGKFTSDLTVGGNLYTSVVRSINNTSTGLQIADSGGNVVMTFDTSAKKVGIGMTPSYTLDVTGTFRCSSDAEVDGNLYAKVIRAVTDGATGLQFASTGGNVALALDTTNRIVYPTHLVLPTS